MLYINAKLTWTMYYQLCNYYNEKVTNFKKYGRREKYRTSYPRAALCFQKISNFTPYPIRDVKNNKYRNLFTTTLSLQNVG